MEAAERTCPAPLPGRAIGLRRSVPAQLSEASRRSMSTARALGAEVRCAALPAVVSELKRAAGWAALPFEADPSSEGGSRISGWQRPRDSGRGEDPVAGPRGAARGGSTGLVVVVARGVGGFHAYLSSNCLKMASVDRFESV